MCVIIKFKDLDKMNGVMIKYSNKNLQKKIKKLQKVRNTNTKLAVKLGTFPDELYKTFNKQGVHRLLNYSYCRERRKISKILERK